MSLVNKPRGSIVPLLPGGGSEPTDETPVQLGERVIARRFAAHILDLADEPLFVVWTLLWIEPTNSILRMLIGISWVAWVAWQLHAQGTTGQSFGKRFMGIQVVNVADGSPLGLRRTLIRWLLHGLDTLTVVGWIATIFTNRSLADRGTKSAVTKCQKEQASVASSFSLGERSR